jgi:hypothetical protein
VTFGREAVEDVLDDRLAEGDHAVDGHGVPGAGHGDDGGRATVFERFHAQAGAAVTSRRFQPTRGVNHGESP